jgi:hypothetical protein
MLFVGYKGVFADTLLYAGGGTGQSVWDWQGGQYASFTPTSNGVLKSIHVKQQQGDQSYIHYYCKVTTSPPTDRNPATAWALSDDLPASTNGNYIDTYYNFSGNNQKSITAGTTYYIVFGEYFFGNYRPTFQNFTSLNSDDFSSIYREVYGASPTINWVSPIGSNYTTDNHFNFSFTGTILQPTSMFPRIVFQRSNLNDTSTPLMDGFWDLYGASYPAGGFTINGVVGDIPSGYYTNFKVYLLDIFNNILASSTAPAYTELFIEAPGSQPPTSYGQFQYYTGSSTSYYNSILPSIFTNNGIATPTSIYSNVTSFIDSVLNPIYGIAQNWQSYFNATSSATIGAQVKSGIITIWSWFKSIDNFMGGYPYSTTFLVFLFAEFAILVIKLLRVILFR